MSDVKRKLQMGVRLEISIAGLSLLDFRLRILLFVRWIPMKPRNNMKALLLG